MIGLVLIIRAHADAAERSAASPEQAGHGQNDGHDGHAHAYGGHGGRAVVHVPDIDAIHHIVAQGNKLGQHGGNGQRQKKTPADIFKCKTP